MFQFGGMKEGDFIVSINEKDVKWAHHEEVVKLIKEAGDSLTLKLVTPMDRNYLKVKYRLILEESILDLYLWAYYDCWLITISLIKSCQEFQLFVKIMSYLRKNSPVYCFQIYMSQLIQYAIH